MIVGERNRDLCKRRWELFGKYEWAREWKAAGEHLFGLRLPWIRKLNEEVYPHIKAQVEEFECKLKRLSGHEIIIENPDTFDKAKKETLLKNATKDLRQYFDEIEFEYVTFKLFELRLARLLTRSHEDRPTKYVRNLLIN